MVGTLAGAVGKGTEKAAGSADGGAERGMTAGSAPPAGALWVAVRFGVL